MGGYKLMSSKYEGTLFNSIVENTILREGSEKLDTTDKRGKDYYSKYGVTQGTLNNYRKARGLPYKDISELSKGGAKDIYYNEFYVGRGIDKLNKNVQQEVFDWEINGTKGMGIKGLQHIVNAKEDGVVGPETSTLSETLGNFMPEEINAELLRLRKENYKTMRPDLKQQYSKGWNNRITEALK